MEIELESEKIQNANFILINTLNKNSLNSSVFDFTCALNITGFIFVCFLYIISKFLVENDSTEENYIDADSSDMHQNNTEK